MHSLGQGIEQLGAERWAGGCGITPPLPPPPSPFHPARSTIAPSSSGASWRAGNTCSPQVGQAAGGTGLSPHTPRRAPPILPLSARPPHRAEGRFIFALQALGTLGVYLITGATFGALYPLSQSARLTVTVGAGLLLLPLLLIPHGSGGLLSQKAVLHHALSHYPDQDEPGPEDEEAAGHGGRGGRGGATAAGDPSLVQPLLEPGMQRDGRGALAPGPAPGVAEVAADGPEAEAEEGSEADPELAAAIAASLREAEAAGLGLESQAVGLGLVAEATAGRLDLEPAVVDDSAPDLITFEPAVLDDNAQPATGAVAAAATPAAAAAPAVPAAAGSPDEAADGCGPAGGRPPSPFGAPGAQAQLPPELSPMQCLRSSDFWLLFLVLCIGMGSGEARAEQGGWGLAAACASTAGQPERAAPAGSTQACGSAFCSMAAQHRPVPTCQPLCIGMAPSCPAAGLTLVNNLSQLVKALTSGASALEVTPVLVSVFSVCNCAGGLQAACWPLLSITARTPAAHFACREQLPCAPPNFPPRTHGPGLFSRAPVALAGHAPCHLPAARLRPHGRHVPGARVCAPARALPTVRAGRLCFR